MGCRGQATGLVPKSMTSGAIVSCRIQPTMVRPANLARLMCFSRCAFLGFQRATIALCLRHESAH